MNEEQEEKLDLIFTRALDNALENSKNGTSFKNWRDNPALKEIYREDEQSKLPVDKKTSASLSSSKIVSKK